MCARLPGIARDSFKLRLDLTPRADWNLGLNLVAASNVQARGDENNRDANGPVGGWSVLNFDARHEWSHSLSFHVRIDNLFDRRYANFGILGQNAFTGPGGAFDGANARREQFRGHGAPRRLVAGLQYSL